MPPTKLGAGDFGDEVVWLHEALAKWGFEASAEERRRKFFGPTTREAVARFQSVKGLDPTGELSEDTAALLAMADGPRAEPAAGRHLEPQAARLGEDVPATLASSLVATGPGDTGGADSGAAGALEATVRRDGDGSDTLTVGGTVQSPDRAGVGGLRVAVVDRNVGEDVPLAEAITDERGRFAVAFDTSVLLERGKPRADLQARAYAGEVLVGASEVRYDASSQETLDILLPAGVIALASEHEALTGALAAHYGGPLAELRESDEHPDVTYLANKSGWDARAVALAALAERFSEESMAAGGPGLQPALFYALFRAGLPADGAALYRAEPETVAAVWRRALADGVIARELEGQLEGATETFRRLAAAGLLEATAFPGASTVQDLARHAIGDDPERHRGFADLLVRHRSDPRVLWAELGRAYGREAAERLRVDGRLAYLTLDNAPLVERLHDAEGGVKSVLELARRGYHRAERWAGLIDGSVPGPIPGETPDERRANYAELLAEQVRLAFPTSVVAALIAERELPLDAPAVVLDGVTAFLSEHEGRFELGVEPVDRYIARNGLGDRVDEPVRRQIRRVQRVYQITATDEAMTALLRHDLDSAYRIAAYEESEFVQTFGAELGGEEQARLTHAKAQQVHGAVLNVAGTYLTGRTAPTLGSNPAAPLVGTAASPAAAAALTGVIAYPTLEGLFGSLDFCACDHCRSIFSPAAYLVDLLLLLDRSVNAKENPLTVLLERRPDIQHLPLTCENTNTPLPYVDIVNETLEYFVAHGLSLAGYTGHDTGDAATAEELLASPQYVDESAYTALRTASFPPPLPFHKGLETVRRQLRRLEVPLPQAMETLRTSEAIERPAAGAYAWRDILMERLGISRQEHRLLTDRNVSLQELAGFPAATALADVLTALRSVRGFTRRTSITVAELAAILRTGFVNPNGALLPRLERLHVSLDTLKAVHDGTLTDAEFEALLPAGLDPAEYGGDVVMWVKAPANYARIMGLITIAAPTAGDDCSVEQLTLRFSEPDDATNALTALDYVRLLRFIRLWKKLGWTIEETDAAIGALFAGDPATAEGLDNGFVTLLQRLGVVVGVMERLRSRRSRDLARLLACWAPIATAGPDALYRQLFLRPAVSTPDTAFADDGYGDVLQDAAANLLDHAETLRAAFNLTAAELGDIVGALGYDATTPLTIATVSAVHRRSWLARALRLSVRELLALIRATGLDPFAAPDPPRPPVGRLLELLDALAAASLKPAQALYLIWNIDLSGRSAPDTSEITELARSLRAEAATIERDFVVADDPTGEIARARMALVYGTDATDFFFGLLAETLTVSVPYDHSQATLEPAIVGAAGGRIAYDDLRKALSYEGIPSAATRDALKAIAGVSPAFKDAVDDLYEAGQTAIAPFFARYPELQAPFSAYVTSTDPPEVRRNALLASFLPELKRRRKAQQAIAVAAAAGRTDGPLALTLLGDAAVLHAVGDPGQPALADLAATEAPGLAARFFWRASATGAPDHAEDIVPVLDYSGTGPLGLPANPTAGDPISGIWSGWIEAPQSGFYNVAIETDAAATVTLRLAGASVVLSQAGSVWTNQSPISLAAGALHEVTLTVERVTDTLAVRWQTTGEGWQTIPAPLLYSRELLGRLRTTHVRFLKVSALATALRLRPAEVAHFAADGDHRIGGEGWLNALNASGEPAVAIAQALRDVLAALLDFVRIRAASAPADDELVTLLAAPAATLPNGDAALPVRLGWDSGSLGALLTHFGLTLAGLAHVDALRRVHDAYALARTSGIPATALIAATTNEPSGGALQGLEAAVRARYDRDDVLDVIKEVHDELRDLRRQALVAHVLHGLAANPATSHIDTADKLFEFFLTDVEMEPCMQTSRIRHALSSVQLFAERCLMNLETRVAASSIDAGRWEWMKRYRVWEANRKVFCFPEQFLEPELRDDQSPFFRETIGELLQGDITEDAAATALVKYLSKLEEVAQLEPCGMHFSEGILSKLGLGGPPEDEAHVVARTPGGRRTHYYRCRRPSGWTPWERIPLEIEDNPVIPAMWRNRLFLFWLRILQETPVNPASLPTTSPSGPLAGITLGTLKSEAAADARAGVKVRVNAVLCWSEYYQGRWQPAKSSDPNRPTELGWFDTQGSPFDRSALRLGVSYEQDDSLRVWISGSGSSSFAFYNTYSPPVREEEAPSPPPLPAGQLNINWGWKWADRVNGKLQVTYQGPFIVDSPWWPPPAPIEHSVLEDAWPFTVAQPRQVLLQPWPVPFFVADSRRVYWVTPAKATVTVADFNGFGVVVPQKARQLAITSPLVLKVDPVIEARAPEVLALAQNEPGFGVFDPLHIRRYVAVSPTIHHGFASDAPVRFGDKTIGPAGALP